MLIILFKWQFLRDEEYLQANDRSGQNSIPYTPAFIVRQVTWTPPPFGWVKINDDGYGRKRNLGGGGGGLVLLHKIKKVRL